MSAAVRQGLPADIRKACIQIAHHHHRIENHNYFPAFRRVLPQIGKGIDLLEKDHKDLEESLHRTHALISNLDGTLIKKSYLTDLQTATTTLERMISRHLIDEEEIIVPVFLSVQ